MKKPAASTASEPRTKRSTADKAAEKAAAKSQRKASKAASRASADLDSERAEKKSSQKKALKSAAKQLQKELNGRMNEMVARIRKETKAKLKEVVKEATRRLDGDTERMFEEALHTIVRHYDSVAPASAGDTESSDAPAGAGQYGRRKNLTLNKDGSPRKPRALRVPAAATTPETTPKRRGRKPAAALAEPPTKRRGPKPGTPATGARRGPKPAGVAMPEANDVLNSADSASTGEISA